MKMKISIALVISWLSLYCYAQDTYERIVEMGIEAVKDYKLTEAEQLFKKALQIAPDDYRNALIYMNLGKVQEMTNKGQEAIESYSAAITLFPQNVTFLRSRADLYLKLENYNKAISDYTDIIEKDTNNIDAYSFRGFAYSKIRKLDQAKTDFAIVIQKEPKNYMTLLGMVIIEQQMGHERKAMTQLNLLIDTYSEKAELYSIRAEMEIKVKQNELAIVDLNKAIELDSNNPNYILTRAYLHLSMKNKRLARIDFKKAIELGVPQYLLQKDLKKAR